MVRISHYLSQNLEKFLLSIVFLAAIILFSYIADENVLEKNYHFDTTVLNFVKIHATPFLVKIMLVVTFFGSTKFLLPAYIIMTGFLLWKHKKVIALEITCIAGSGTLIMFLLKNYFHRHRPNSIFGNELLSYSFPSGHSVSSLIFCGIISFIVWKTNISIFKKYSITSFLLLYAFLVGMSRIILMVHYATDVIAGFCFAIAWLIISFWIVKIVRSRYYKKSD
ncbi:phosphatase PAP2 family protein [Halpernia sp. GG3]